MLVSVVEVEEEEEEEEAGVSASTVVVKVVVVVVRARMPLGSTHRCLNASSTDMRNSASGSSSPVRICTAAGEKWPGKNHVGNGSALRCL